MRRSSVDDLPFQYTSEGAHSSHLQNRPSDVPGRCASAGDWRTGPSFVGGLHGLEGGVKNS